MKNFPFWELPLLVFGFTYHFIAIPLLFISDVTFRLYRRTTRMIEIQLTHTKAWTEAREAREAANRTHHFMKLPSELRNRIYALSMVSDAVLDPVWGCISDLKRIDNKQYFLDEHGDYPRYRSQMYYDEQGYEANAVTASRMANMSQVCKVWREEAVRLYYGTNIFKFPIGKQTWHRTQSQQQKGAGTPALTTYYTRWLRELPKEAFSMVRLVLHDYRVCPHPFVGPRDPNRRARWATPTKTGGCLIFVDFDHQMVSAVRGNSERNYRDLWHCQICWPQYVDAVWGLNGTEALNGLFVGVNGKLDAGSTIKSIERLRAMVDQHLESAAAR